MKRCKTCTRHRTSQILLNLCCPLYCLTYGNFSFSIFPSISFEMTSIQTLIQFAEFPPKSVLLTTTINLKYIYKIKCNTHIPFFSMKVNHSEMCSYLRDKLRWMVQIHVSKRGMFNKRNVSLFVMLRFKTRNDEMDAINYSICMMVNRSK